MKQVTESEIEIVYRKLKSHFYNDNSNMFVKMKIAEFEENIDKNIKYCAEMINDYAVGKKDKLNEELKSIKFKILPKKFKSPETASGIFFFKGSKNQQAKIVEKINYFIDCSIYIHIIDVLWIIKIGEKIDKGINPSCYANRLFRKIDIHLHDEDTFTANRIKLFRNYKDAYPKWRDESIKQAKALHELGLDTCLINIDIKEYYYSINFDYELINQSENIYLNEMLKSIHISYREKVTESDKFYTNYHTNNFLPIGLLSSGILANFYLKKYDFFIENSPKPAFYGRYVDDMIFVISNPKITISDRGRPEHKDIVQILESLGIKQDGENEQRDQISESLRIEEFQNLKLQSEKVKIYFFGKNDSISILNEFEKQIQKNSSEFKYQVVEDDIFTDIESPFFKIDYSDTINKFRSIEKQSTDKLAASKYFAKLIRLSSVSKISKARQNKIDEAILDFFDGQTLLELYNLWEKIFSYYVTIESDKYITYFLKKILKEIDKIQTDTKDEINLNEIKRDLFNYLLISFSIAISLKASYAYDYLKKIKLLDNDLELNKKLSDSTDEIKNQVNKIISANMLRHYFVSFPLINYVKLDGDQVNFSDPYVYYKMRGMELDDKKIRFSPRFIHFHEFSLFNFLKKSITNNVGNTVEDTKNLYRKCNMFHERGVVLDSILRVEDANLGNEYPKISHLSIKDKSSYFSGQVKFAIVNMIVDKKNIESSIESDPNISIDRLIGINKALNEAIVERCNIVVFPEVSIPFLWSYEIAQFSKKNNIIVVFGAEHLVINKIAYNFVCVVIPFNTDGYQNSIIDFRLKKDYSPEEEYRISGLGLELPCDQMKNEELRLYNLNNSLIFTVLNCFELTDIKKRSIFLGEIDLLIGVEYNPDTYYFSNIAESVTRDLHTYFIQVNSSDFGDSRILKPSRREAMDIVKIKGGENISILTASINIQSLRKHQGYKYSLQKENNGEFKPTPPHFTLSKKRQKQKQSDDV